MKLTSGRTFCSTMRYQGLGRYFIWQLIIVYKYTLIILPVSKKLLSRQEQSPIFLTIGETCRHIGVWEDRELKQEGSVKEGMHI